MATRSPASEAPRGRSRPGGSRWAGRTTLLVLGAGAGWFGGRRLEAAAAGAPAASQETAAVERRELGATVLATGVIRPKVGAQVAVGSRVSGVLERLHVTVGDRVRAGELLAELGRVEFETGVRRAEASRVNALSELAYNEKELARARQLAAIAGVTEAQLAAAVRAVDASTARLRDAEASVEAANVQLGYASIRAPIDGVVASVSTQEGETVAASFAAPTFLTIVDLNRLEVWAYVDETDIGRIRVGQEASFTVDSWPDHPFPGRVIAIRPSAEIRDNVVTYVTLIAFTNSAERVLRPEMTATINIQMEPRRDALAVPNTALRRDSGGTWVMVQSATGPERRPVTVGYRGSDHTEVLTGLREGDRVVTGTAACAGTPALPPPGRLR